MNQFACYNHAMSLHFKVRMAKGLTAKYYTKSNNINQWSCIVAINYISHKPTSCFALSLSFHFLQLLSHLKVHPFLPGYQAALVSSCSICGRQ